MNIVQQLIMYNYYKLKYIYVNEKQYLQFYWYLRADRIDAVETS